MNAQQYFIPGSFGETNINAYEDIGEDYIQELKVALTKKGSGGIANFGLYKPLQGTFGTATSGGERERLEYLQKLRQLYATDPNLNKTEYAEKTKRILSDPDIEKIFVLMGGAIAAREGGGIARAKNPRNFQGIWQVYAIETSLEGNKCFEGGKTRYSILTCPMIQQVYQRNKSLSDVEKMYQTLDMLVELDIKFRNFEQAWLIGNGHPRYRYSENIKIWLDVLFRGKGYDTELITKAVVSGDNNTLLTILAKERDILGKVGIRTPDDFKKFKEYVYMATIGVVYNGAANNGHWALVQKGVLRNVLDHQYISSIPELNFRMYGIRRDGGPFEWNRPDANLGVIPSILKNRDPSGTLLREYHALVLLLRQGGEMRASK